MFAECRPYRSSIGSSYPYGTVTRCSRNADRGRPLDIRFFRKILDMFRRRRVPASATADEMRRVEDEPGPMPSETYMSQLRD
jgi:hypothetical protein